MRGALLGASLVLVAPPIATSAPVAPLTARWHPKLLRSMPAAGETLKAPPASITLWFSEPIELGVSRLRLQGAGAAPVALGKAAVVPGTDGNGVSASVPTSLAAGTYTVTWTAASADGHPMRGTYVFTVQGK